MRLIVISSSLLMAFSYTLLQNIAITSVTRRSSRFFLISDSSREEGFTSSESPNSGQQKRLAESANKMIDAAAKLRQV
jgi:hypothetical protein